MIKNLNLFKSPYFSLIGNLGSSKKSFVLSITPECWPKAYLKPNDLIISLNAKLYSPKGYEKNTVLFPNFFLKILMDFKISSLITTGLSSIKYSCEWLWLAISTKFSL